VLFHYQKIQEHSSLFFPAISDELKTVLWQWDVVKSPVSFGIHGVSWNAKMPSHFVNRVSIQGFKSFSQLGTLSITSRKTNGLYYKHLTIINDDPSIVNKWSFKLIYDARVIIYDRNRFKIQAAYVNHKSNFNLMAEALTPT